MTQIQLSARIWRAPVTSYIVPEVPVLTRKLSRCWQWSRHYLHSHLVAPVPPSLSSMGLYGNPSFSPIPAKNAAIIIAPMLAKHWKQHQLTSETKTLMTVFDNGAGFVSSVFISRETYCIYGQLDQITRINIKTFVGEKRAMNRFFKPILAHCVKSDDPLRY